MSFEEQKNKETERDGYDVVNALVSLPSSSLFGSSTPTSSVAYSLEDSVVNTLRGHFRTASANASSIYSIVNSSNPDDLNEISIKGQELLGQLQFLSMSIVQSPVDIRIGGFDINKGQSYISPHINANSSLGKEISPIKRAKIFLEEFKIFCDIAREDESLNEMPIIGRSHLARFFEKNSNIYTEKVKGKVARLIGKIDSQIVSNMFGGNRKVSANDVTRFYIPAGVNPF